MPVPHHSAFTGRMPFLLPNLQRQSTEGTPWQCNPAIDYIVLNACNVHHGFRVSGFLLQFRDISLEQSDTQNMTQARRQICLCMTAVLTMCFTCLFHVVMIVFVACWCPWHKLFSFYLLPITSSNFSKKKIKTTCKLVARCEGTIYTSS